ncbi:MAG: transporter permease [Chromatiaceae bacterium]|nr:transporter permease [Chromatiaceae bacterium]
MSGLLAWRNLAHDRSRLVVTMVGVVFAVVLIAIQIGLYLGFVESATTIITHTRADLWMVAKGTRNFEITVPIHEREAYLARSVPGVAHAEGLMVQFVPWKKPEGGDESVLLVGFDLNRGLAGPWNLVEGDLEALRRPDTVVVDRLFADKLGVRGPGDQVEINGHRARVVALTQGIRSFTTSPWVFTAARTAQEMSGFDSSQWNYVIATVAAGHDPDEVRDTLSAAIPRADVYTSQELAETTRDYWLFTTGAGASVLVSAVLGLLVGAVIVAQVLYATTVDHLSEFGTLRAMGAPRGFVYRVILSQAAISATVGHLIGIAIAMALSKGSEAGSVLILVTPQLALGLYLVTLTMCMGASIVSIRKAMTIDPAMVFQR